MLYPISKVIQSYKNRLLHNLVNNCSWEDNMNPAVYSRSSQLTFIQTHNDNGNVQTTRNQEKRVSSQPQHPSLLDELSSAGNENMPHMIYYYDIQTISLSLGIDYFTLENTWYVCPFNNLTILHKKRIVMRQPWHCLLKSQYHWKIVMILCYTLFRRSLAHSIWHFCCKKSTSWRLILLQIKFQGPSSY